ncbi:MAG: GNAT family N-acetyltransferase [Coriobacteriia bacterium]|nr:GNAT family N-acetyltransferase [Coriobacteriia bacterium]
MGEIQFRLATEADLDAIEQIYDAIHDQEESGAVTIGWVRGVYPSRASAQVALDAGDMYVAVDDGVVVAAARINQEQVPEYADAAWAVDAPADQVLVLHTLVVDPNRGGRGYGRQFVAFYEQLARERNCPYLRMDTNERNVRARALYAKLGYAEPDIVPCVFNGIEGVQLVCLEKTLA